MAVTLKGKVINAQPNPQGTGPGMVNIEIDGSNQGFAVLNVPASSTDIAALTIPGSVTLTVSQP